MNSSKCNLYFLICFVLATALPSLERFLFSVRYRGRTEIAVTGTFVPTYESSIGGTFAPWNFRSMEVSLLGTFTPESENDVELSLPDGKMAWNFRSPLSKNVTKCTHGEQGSQDVNTCTRSVEGCRRTHYFNAAAATTHALLIGLVKQS